MDEDYLKMILALPDEFFKGLEWQAGDKVYARNWNMEFLVSFVSPNGVSATKLNSLTPTVTINPDVPINKNVIPIPNQRQIQDMFRKDYFAARELENTDSHLLKMFCHWMITFEWTLAPSTECKLLQFYMYHVYKKSWIEGEWG